MKSFMKSTVFIISGLLFFIMLAGCTPSRAQTRGNDYAGSFDSENYDEFDREESGDDEIPAYTENKNTDKRDSSARKEKKVEEKTVRVKSGAVKDEGEDFAYDEKSSTSDMGVADNDDNSYESGANADYDRPENFYQKGYASWYGREFHGKPTASGEKFDMNLLTAAHKTLPFGTILEVTNLENGKTVKLKINDRGPYRGNRIIDLSFNAAREIDMVKKGEVKVGIRVIKMGDNSVVNGTNRKKNEYVEPVSDEEYPYQEEKPAKKETVARDDSYDDYSDGSDSIKLQAGAFYSRKNAQSQKEIIEGLTDRPVRIIQDGEYFKIRIEGIKSRKEMDHIKDVLKSENIQSFSVE